MIVGPVAEQLNLEKNITFDNQVFFTSTSGKNLVKKTGLQTLTLPGPTVTRPAVLSFDNREVSFGLVWFYFVSFSYTGAYFLRVFFKEMRERVEQNIKKFVSKLSFQMGMVKVQCFCSK